MRSLFLCLFFLAISTHAPAQPPERLRSPNSKVKYPLTRQEGPYLICIKTFKGGDDSPDYANRLADEFRVRYKMPAYVLEMEDPAAKRDREEMIQQQRGMLKQTTFINEQGIEQKIPLKVPRVMMEYTVFIGPFKAEADARSKLNDVKRLPPPQSLSSNSISIFSEEKNRRGMGVKSEKMDSGPFPTAFVCKNPLELITGLSSADQYLKEKVEQQLQEEIKLNSQEQFSVVSCPKRYTLVVCALIPISNVERTKTSVFDDVRQASSNSGKKTGLEIAAEGSRALANIIRDGGRGFDAYVYHTQTGSYVTVGAFDSKDDPVLLQTIAAFKQTKTIDKFTLLPEPMVIEVPRKK